MKKQVRIWKCIAKKMQQDYLPSFAAHAALFTIMSIFPMVMFLITLIRYLPIKIETIIDYANQYIPYTVLPLFLQIIDEVYKVNGNGIKWITLLTALFCASKGFYAVRQGLNAVYGVKEPRNIVMRNIIAIFYVIAFTVMIVSTISIVVLGADLLNLAMHFVPQVFEIQLLISVERVIIILIIQTVFFLAIYVVIPNRKTKISYEIFGALFTAVGWTVFSYAFSYYKANIAHYTVIYGSLATMVVFMLWFYFSMYILLLGAECNYFYRLYLESAKNIDKVIESYECF